MNRRQLLIRSSSIATVGMAALAGCSTTGEAPPRKSNVIKEIEVQDASTITIEPINNSNQWVMSRQDIDISEASTAQVGTFTSLKDLSPVGVASAKGRGAAGRGATGGSRGFSSAPKTTRGRARYGGGSYVPIWYDDHDDEVERYPVNITTIGIKYFGESEDFREKAPSPGPVDWDETFTRPQGEVTISANEIDIGQTFQQGWYRVGSQIVTADGETNMGWEAFDFKVAEEDGEMEITKIWKVSPRI